MRWWNGVSWTTQTTALVQVESSTSGSSASLFHLRVEHDELAESSATGGPELVGALSLGVEGASSGPRLEDIEDARRALVEGGQAVRCATAELSRCSAAELAQVAADLGELVLGAYDAEVDTLIRTLRPHTAAMAIARLDELRASISRLGASMQLAITDEYHALRRREVQLTADYLAQLAEQREREREATGELEAEEREFRRLEAERQHLETERAHYEAVAAALRAKGDAVLAGEAEHHVAKVNGALDEVTGQLARLRSGYVYVLTNIGVFGDSVVKIGLTRRSDPQDCLRELGADSVPFRFDTHALVFSQDAVSLASSLRHDFADRRVNLVDPRCEFFYITPQEAKDALLRLHDGVVSFVDVPEATEWRQSEEERRRRRSSSQPAIVPAGPGWQAGPTRLRPT